MGAILNIETATSLCSVALAIDGKVISQREAREEKAHASLLTAFIEEILKEQGIGIRELDALAVGKGPGSYTGLRIGVAAAKGLCFGSKLPLIAISTLKVLFRQLWNTSDPDIRNALQAENTLVCPMIDARRMEVFTCLYTTAGELVEEVAAKIIDQDSYNSYYTEHRIIFLGSGMDKCRPVLSHSNALFADQVYPHASALAALSESAYQQSEFEDLAYFEPFYLKDFITTVPKKKLSF